jgi:hypothetical protein
MRAAGRPLLAVALGTIGALWVAMPATASTPSAGISIAPAAATLGLAKGQHQVQASIRLANHYSTPVTLHFAIEPSRQDNLGGTDPSTYLYVSPPDVSIGAGASATQVVTFADSSSVTPGSHSADLVVSLMATPTQQGIGVLPSMRLPITAIKYDGAVSGLGAATVNGPHFSMGIPSEAQVTVHNTGNVVAIPRGTAIVTAPGGVVVGKAVLNEASRAVAPGDSIVLSAPITRLATATVPGPYTIRADYGLGGDSPSSTATANFVFVSWWHIAAAAGLGATSWYAVTRRAYLIRILSRLRRTPPKPAPKRQLLIGRDIT